NTSTGPIGFEREEQSMDLSAGGARYHPVTGLPTRVSFVDRLDRTMGRAQRTADHLFAVLCVGVHGLNGHRDAVMTDVASRLSDAVRPHDIVAQVADDELSVLLSHLRASEDALRVADRLHRALGANGGEQPVRASIGVSVSGAAYEHGEELLRDA